MQHHYVLTSRQKAAAVLIAMGKQRAKQLLKYFKGEELRMMIEAGHALKDLPPTDVEALVREFEEAFVEGSGIIDSRDAIDAIIDGAETEGGPATGDLLTTEKTPKTTWELIGGVETVKLAKRLGGEPPQLIAALLPRLAPEKSAAVLASLDEHVQPAVIAAMMLARGIPAERLDPLGTRLVRDFRLEHQPNSMGGGEAQRRAAEILNAMDKEASENLMRNIRDHLTPKQLAELQARLFRFDDLVLLQPIDRALVLDGLPGDLLARALRGTNDELREAILASISQRFRKIIETELSDRSRDTPAQIEEARKSITQLANKLALEGRITLPERG